MYTKLKLLSGAAILSIFATPAFAQQETAAGTNINNQATVTFNVGGTSGTATSNTATFVVDKKVNLSVVAVGGPTRVSIGSNDQVTTWTVTNLTNSTQDIRLSADQQNVSIPILGTDDFNVSNMRIFRDTNNNGQWDAGDAQVTYLDELAADASVTVFIVANIPNTQGIHTAIVGLQGTVAAGGSAGSLGADLVATSILTPDSPTTVDIVFADDANLLDQPRDGKHWAFNSYFIDSAVVSVVKTSRVISDPYNLLVNPKAIPGATVEYCLSVSNAGPGIATGVVLSDIVPTNTTYVPGSIVVGTAGVGTCILVGTAEDDDATGADESDPVGGSFDTGTRTVLGALNSVLPSTTVNVAFRVTIN
jgi:uncharacterized repeat protein (TIGR01451 family)